jgi:site-specific DNA recombinase
VRYSLEDPFCHAARRHAAPTGNRRVEVWFDEPRRSIYRNIKDWVTIDELGIEVHFVKEAVVLSEDSRSSEKSCTASRSCSPRTTSRQPWRRSSQGDGMIEKARQGH